MMYEHPETLDLVSEELLWDLLTVNMGSVTMLTRKVLPQMIGRRRGAIVNLGSSSELQPLPTMTVYAASKKFITYFTKALEMEVQEHNIHVQLVMPNFVTTKMNAYSDRVMKSGASLIFPNASSYAKSAVFTLGKTSETNGFWTHGIQVCQQEIVTFYCYIFFIDFNYYLVFNLSPFLQYSIMKLAPLSLRTYLGHKMFKQLRIEALQQKQQRLKLL